MNNSEDIEARLLACTAPLHPQRGSEALLLRLFREQDARLRRRQRAQACGWAALAAAACLVFCAVSGLAPLARPAAALAAATPPLPPTLPQAPPVEESPTRESDDDIDSGVPGGTIDDILKKALATAP